MVLIPCTFILAVLAPACAPVPSPDERPSVTLRLQTPDGKVARNSPFVKMTAESIPGMIEWTKVVERPEVARLPLIKAQKGPGLWLHKHLEVQTDEQEATLVLRMRAGDAATQAKVLNAVAEEVLAVGESVRKRLRDQMRDYEDDLKFFSILLANAKEELQKELARRVGVNGEPDAKKVELLRNSIREYDLAIEKRGATVKRIRVDLRTMPRCVIVRKAKVPQGED